MIEKIVLSNFMAHALTELNLADGLTVLVGPNNIGKSTIAVALKILARNSNSNFVMQHDQKECSITVETSEGHVVKWVKRKSPSYIINGQVKDRLGRGGTPPELDETLRLAPIEFEDKDFEPHFGDQKTPIFLINRPPSQIAQFFSTTSDAERLVAIQRLHHKNRSEAQSQSKLLTELNSTIQSSLDSLSEVPSLVQSLEVVEREREALRLMALSISGLQESVQRLASFVMQQRAELQRSACLQALEPLPSLHATDYLANVVDQWQHIDSQKRQLREFNEVFMDLAPVPILQDTGPLEEANHALHHATLATEYWSNCVQVPSQLQPMPMLMPTSEIAHWVTKCEDIARDERYSKAILSASVSLVPPPPVQPIDELARTIVAIQDCSRELACSAAKDEFLSRLYRVPVPADLAQLQSDIHELAELLAVCKSNATEQFNVEESLNALDATVHLWLESEPVCTTCGAKITANWIHSKHHRHIDKPAPHKAPSTAKSKVVADKRKGSSSP
ncbi:MAG: AAA family ATPase [Pirellula sp.]